MDKCHVDGCNQNVSKPGHKLCYDHWQDEKNGILTYDRIDNLMMYSLKNLKRGFDVSLIKLQA